LNFCKIHHKKIALQFAEHKNKSHKNELSVGGKPVKPVCREAEKKPNRKAVKKAIKISPLA